MASISDIVQQYTDMRQGLKQLHVELDINWSQKTEDMPQDRFYNVMEEYRVSAISRFEELETLYVNMDAKWKDALEYFGEEQKTIEPDEFFGIFSKFISTWKMASTEELRYSQRMEHEEKRHMDIQVKRQKLLEQQRTEDSESPIDDRRLVDNLLEKLRAGESESRIRQSRMRKHLNRLQKDEKPRLQRSLSEKSTQSSHRSSVIMPAISAEDLLRSLQQEDDTKEETQ
jgi:hypothetical protein